MSILESQDVGVRNPRILGLGHPGGLWTENREMMQEAGKAAAGAYHHCRSSWGNREVRTGGIDQAREAIYMAAQVRAAGIGEDSVSVEVEILVDGAAQALRVHKSSIRGWPKVFFQSQGSLSRHSDKT